MLEEKRNLINEEITNEKVMIIGEDGKRTNTIKLDDALGLAYRLGTDLIKINENKGIAVCRLMDADKFRFKMKQKEKKNRQAAKKIVTKEIVFSPHIAENDAEVKMRHIRKILKTGNKVKLTMLMRGREIKFLDKNLSTLNRYAVELKDCAIVQSGPTVDKRSIHILLIPKN